MKHSLVTKKASCKDPGVLAGRYVWSNYSLYGMPEKILFSAEHIEQKISKFEIPRPLLLAPDATLACSAPKIMKVSDNAVDSSRISVCSVSAPPHANQGVLRGSLAIHRGRYMLTDEGESIRTLKKQYKINKATLTHLLGNMRTEREVCVYADELCIVLPDVRNIDRYTHEFAQIIERFRLICDMTLS